jgi:hypothetical protein
MDTAMLTRPVGPLPLWAWGALAGGGVLLLMAHHGSPAAAAALNPAAAVPAPPDLSGGAPAPSGPPVPIPAGATVYDPGTGQTTTPVTLSDLLGGQKLSDFIGALGPDYQSFNLQDGQLGTTVTHSAQNVLTEQNAEATLAAGVAQTTAANALTAAQMQANVNLLGVQGAEYYGGSYTGANGVSYNNPIGAAELAATNYYGGQFSSGGTTYTGSYSPFGLNRFVHGAT